MKVLLTTIICTMVLYLIFECILKLIKMSRRNFFNDFYYKEAFFGNKIKVFYNNDPLIAQIRSNVKSKKNYFVIRPYVKGKSEEESIIRVLYITGEHADYVYKYNSYNGKKEFYQIYNANNFDNNKLRFEYYLKR